MSANPEGQGVDVRTPLLKHGVPEAASLPRKIALLFQDWWLWEILSALIAILSSTLIVVILIIFDSSALPDWPSVFTVGCIILRCSPSTKTENCVKINSTISFLAVIAKLAITSALGASISQSKWLWYRQEEPRPLTDLQIFEDASKGPLGALALLFGLKARSALIRSR